MKCDLCGKRTAVVFVQEGRADKPTELRLCSECARERGVRRLEGDLGASISGLLSDLAGSASAAPEAPAERCPSCACSLAELRQRGMASCPACYEAFSRELFRAVYPDAAARRHSGRLPSRLAADAEAERALDAARRSLRSALEAEDYEEAARCRDAIRALRGGGKADA